MTRGRGKLIAVEGTRGADVIEAGQRLWRHLTDGKSGGVSRWDASGTFYEVSLTKAKHLTPVPRTLLLLYASDLVFRLRWEIRPFLAEGQTVVVAPYVHTAIAFGAAAGVPRKWLTELFRFAPAPQACYHVKERKKGAGWKGRPRDGFLEFCSRVIGSYDDTWDPVDARRAAIRAIERFERDDCEVLTKKKFR